MSDILIKPRQRPRMFDISMGAGVSIGTVSRVLNGKSDVAPELAERVRVVARKMGYELRSLNRQPQPTPALGSIAYLLDGKAARVLTDTFQQHFLTGIDQRINELEGHLIYSSCVEEIENGALPSIVSNRVARGAIIKGDIPDAWIEKVSAAIPTVLLMSETLSRTTPSVVCDNAAATFQLMQYLRDLGHRRIGFIYEKESHHSTSFHHREREQAYLRYVEAMGLEFRPEYVQAPSREREDEDVTEVMARGLKSFLSLKDQRPTALICTADVYAFSLLRIASTMGLSVPEDLSVASYLNTSACDHSSPPLTSVCLSGEEIGRTAVDLLESRIREPAAPIRHILVAPRLIERASCVRPSVRRNGI